MAMPPRKPRTPVILTLLSVLLLPALLFAGHQQPVLGLDSERKTGQRRSHALELLEKGTLNHQRGDLNAAEEKYREALEIDSTIADAHHLLGIVAHHRGESGERKSMCGMQ